MWMLAQSVMFSSMDSLGGGGLLTHSKVLSRSTATQKWKLLHFERKSCPSKFLEPRWKQTYAVETHSSHGKHNIHVNKDRQSLTHLLPNNVSQNGGFLTHLLPNNVSLFCRAVAFCLLLDYKYYKYCKLWLIIKWIL